MTRTRAVRFTSWAEFVDAQVRAHGTERKLAFVVSHRLANDQVGLEVTPQDVNRWRRGHLPTIEKVAAVVHALGVSLDVLPEVGGTAYPVGVSPRERAGHGSDPVHRGRAPAFFPRWARAFPGQVTWGFGQPPVRNGDRAV